MRIPLILMRKSFERAGTAPEVFRVGAALIQDRTSRKKRHPGGLSGRVVGRSGALYRRVAQLYRRVAPTLAACVNLLPGTSRGFLGASCGL